MTTYLPHEANIISLDGDCNIHTGEVIAIIKPAVSTPDSSRNKILSHDCALLRINNIIHKSITGYGISGKATEVELEKGDWVKPKDNFDLIRKTTVYCQPEEIELAGEPINDEITDQNIGELYIEGVYNNLLQGRRIVFSGEKAGNEGGQFRETGKITSVSKKTEKFLQLRGKEIEIGYTNISVELDNKDVKIFQLKRDTVKIYGNVVAASQGETRREVLGSGDGRKEAQAFVLKQANKDAHLTYVSAATATGSASTLKVFVNDIRWHETDILSNCTSIDQKFITKTDEEGGVSVIFGNGKKGARLPTGIENIRAEYRTGIGDAGNVKPGQISLLVDRPLGVKEVINPVAASSGSDKDKLNQARKNALRAIRALDRLISVQDYEDFAATYAGIGKAKAVELSNGQRQVVHVTIAGTSSHPDKQLTDSSDLVKNLKKSLYNYGDPQQEVQLKICELLHIVLKANVCILPDYNWEKVEAELRSKLLDVFSFEQLELGQDVFLGEVYSIMQAVPGVDYVDVDTFGGIPEKIKDKKLTAEEIAFGICLQSKQIPSRSRDGEEEKRFMTIDEMWNEIDSYKYICPKMLSDEKTAHGKHIDILHKECDCHDSHSFDTGNCKRYAEFKEWFTKNEEQKGALCDQAYQDKHELCKHYCADTAKTAKKRLVVNLADFENSSIRPAQLAFLSPDLPETLILKQIK